MAVIAIHPGEQLAEELKELGMSAADWRASWMCPPIASPGF
jgi:hypothetical protein